MKRQKIILLLSALALLLPLAACGAGKTLSERAGEALAEKAIENAGGGDVEIDGSEVTVRGENGEEVTVGGAEWPKSGLAVSLPRFGGGTVTAVLDSADYLMITLESVSEADAAAYFETVKKAFDQESYEVQSEDGVTYGAQNGEGTGVALYYSGGTLTIAVSAPAQ